MTTVKTIDKIPSDRLWAMICHLSALIGYLIPVGNIVAPLAIWLVKRKQSPYVDQQGKEAVNFQITITIAAFIAFLLIFVVVGIILLPLVGLINLILILLAAFSSYKGEAFRYPFCLRLIK